MQQNQLPLPGTRCPLLLRWVTALCWVIAILLPKNSQARQTGDTHPYADSLEQVLHGKLAAADRAQNLFLLSQYWADLDSAKGVQYALQALEYNPHDAYSEGMAHYYLGSAFFDYDKPRAQQEYQQAIQWLQQSENTKAFALLSKAWHNYGALEERQGREKNFADILLNKVIPLAIRAGDTLHLGNYYLSLSVVFGNIYDYDRAIEYARKAAQVFNRQQPGSEYLIECYTKIAEHYLSKEDLNNAKPFLDSAALALQRYPVSALGPAYYQTEGRYYNLLKKWPQALTSFQHGLQLAEQTNRLYDAATISMEVYQAHKAQHHFDTAKQILLTLYHRPYVKEMPENMRLILRELASTDSALHQPWQAYHWMLQYTTLTDSLTGNQTRVQISELEAKYNYAEKEKELLQLQARSGRQKLLLWGSLALLAGTSVLFVYLYRQHRFKAAQREQIVVAQALLQGEERERARLARDLHDGLGGMLAGMKIHLSEMVNEQDNTLHRIIGQLDHSVAELRRIARNMMPEALLRSGLERALEDLCDAHSTDKLKVILQTIDISASLPLQVQLIVYRIVQELLANVVKHALATEVLIQCSQLDNIFYITAEDNGKGFSPEAVEQSGKGIGLDNIKHRVAFLQGKIDIRSRPGQGTVINIELLCQ